MHSFRRQQADSSAVMAGHKDLYALRNLVRRDPRFLPIAIPDDSCPHATSVMDMFNAGRDPLFLIMSRYCNIFDT